jgi:hypothetical protein
VDARSSQESGPPSSAPEPLSYRTAALRSVANPGSGQIYAGQKTRGRIVMAAFLASVLWAGLVGLGLVMSLREILQSMLTAGGAGLGSGPTAAPSFVGVLFSLLPFLLAELIWFAALADCLHLTRQENRRRGFDMPPHPVMVAITSMCSPGAGHLYSGASTRGWRLVAGYCAVKLANLPANVYGIVTLTEALRSITGMDPAVIQALMDKAGALSASPTGFLIDLVWILALADAISGCQISSQRAPEGGASNALLTVSLAYLCPGSGHLYLGEEKVGRGILGAYLVLTGLATLTGFGALGWLVFLVTLGSLVHALVLLHGRSVSPAP